MAKAPTPVCLTCGRSKADEPDQFYVRSRLLKSGLPCLSSHCVECTKTRVSRRYTHETRKCLVEGCENTAASICSLHRGRKAREGDYGEGDRRRARKGDGFIDQNGYYRVRRPGRSVLDHVYVMEEHLGRRLREKENVHHRNGVRHDNRIENLELWSRSQPCGQRVTDKIEWAQQFLTQYLTPTELLAWAKGIGNDGDCGPD